MVYSSKNRILNTLTAKFGNLDHLGTGYFCGMAQRKLCIASPIYEENAEDTRRGN